MTVTIVAALPLTDGQRTQIEACGDVEILEVPPQPDPGLLVSLAGKAEVWFGPRIRPNLLERAPALRWIQLVNAGVDRYLFPELVDSPIVLTNVRGMHADTIADHVFMFILAFARDLRGFLQDQQDNVWSRREQRVLSGDTIAIVGLGSIGSAVARRAKSFGMHVVGTRRRPAPVEGVDRVLPPEDLPDAIEGAQWVILSCPLTRETFHLIGEKELRVMGSRTVLINIARGKVVDENALVEALREGWIGGAGLDVFEQEPLPETSPLWTMPNVLITPHVSGSVGTWEEYMDKATAIFCDNLRRYLAGDELMNVIDKQAGY